MTSFRIIKILAMWSTDKLTSYVERTLKEKSEEGYEIVSVAFGVNLWRDAYSIYYIKNNPLAISELVKLKG